jgi:DNA-binding MarR family transcriptional regulator
MTTKQLHEYELIDSTISVAAHLESELEEALAEHHLSRGSFLVLLALADAEGESLGQGELVSRVRRTSGTMSVRLGRLERVGVIERERDPERRRNVTVRLTERGRELVEAARPLYEERARHLISGLPDETRGELVRRIPEWLAFFEPDERSAPRLGVAVAPAAVAARMRRAVGLTAEPGVLVIRVKPDSPASQAGLAQGDLIVQVGGEAIRSVGDLDRAVRGAGHAVTVNVLRGAEPRELEATLS